MAVRYHEHVYKRLEGLLEKARSGGLKVSGGTVWGGLDNVRVLPDSISFEMAFKSASEERPECWLDLKTAIYKKLINRGLIAVDSEMKKVHESYAEQKGIAQNPQHGLGEGLRARAELSNLRTKFKQLLIERKMLAKTSVNLDSETLGKKGTVVKVEIGMHTPLDAEAIARIKSLFTRYGA